MAVTWYITDSRFTHFSSAFIEYSKVHENGCRLRQIVEGSGHAVDSQARRVIDCSMPIRPCPFRHMASTTVPMPCCSPCWQEGIGALVIHVARTRVYGALISRIGVLLMHFAHIGDDALANPLRSSGLFHSLSRPSPSTLTPGPFSPVAFSLQLFALPTIALPAFPFASFTQLVP
jgi:hypothetical protein